MKVKLKHLLIFLSFVPISILLESCKPSKEQSAQNTVELPFTKLLQPKTTILHHLPDSLKPKKIFLHDRPSPVIIKVPKAIGGSYTINTTGDKTSKVLLEPPMKKSLPFMQDGKGEPIKDASGHPIILGSGGISHFTSFTTEHGLALDGIFSSCMDHYGNLWFGTQGGGVSKYDGSSFINFNTTQGLAQNLVSCIIEDSQGHLWFGTQGGGVSTYDGRSFTNYNTADGLANNVVYGIAEDNEGNLWFATLGGGVSKLNIKTKSKEGIHFTNFTVTDGLINNIVYCVTVDHSGNIWFGTLEGVSRYEPNGIGKIGRFTNFTNEQGLAFNYVRSITEDKDNNLWFGTYGGGVSKYDAKIIGVTAFTNFNTSQGLADDHVYNIIQDKADHIWIATNGGISRYDPAPGGRDHPFTTFTTAQGLAFDQVRSITEDKAGNLWFGTDGGGVSKYEGESFTNFTIAQGLALSSIYSIMEDKNGDLWIGNTNGGGLCKYDLSSSGGGTSFTYYTTSQGLVHNNVRSILEDKIGNIWIGTAGGISKYDRTQNTFTQYTTVHGLISNNVRSIAEDSAGILWIATNGGVTRYDPTDDGGSMINYTTAQGLTHDNVQNSMVDKKGNVWFGTTGGGVSEFSQDVQSVNKTARDISGIITNFTTAQGLSHNVIYSITQDRLGNIWFGTGGGGVSRLRAEDIQWRLAHPQEAPKQIFENFTTILGLADDVVYDIVQDIHDNIIIGTNLGFTLIPAKVKEAPFSTIRQSIEYYNTPHGYPVKDINQHAMLSDHKGITWAGTGSEKTGLVRFDYSSIKKTRTPPIVMLQKIKVNGENICWLDLKAKGKLNDVQLQSMARLQEPLAYGKMLNESERDSIYHLFESIRFDSISSFDHLPQELILPNAYHNLAIEFNAVETGYPHQVSYQYMLEGYDKTWNPESKNPSATFGNLNEGSYIFKVKARLANEAWGEPTGYKFAILAPTYRTWWAYLSYALLLLLSLRLLGRWRIRKLTNEKEKLEKTVEERTEELVQKNIIVEKQKGEVEREKQRSDELLLNILPEEVAEELKQSGHAQARQYDHVSVLFTDFVNFTGISEMLSPTELVAEIHKHFTAFDSITDKHGLEKIKTIGDAYLAVCGLPMEMQDHAIRVADAALEIREYLIQTESMFHIRIGIHSGPVVAGIVGVKKYAYDIWGDTVNTAARMEQNSESGKINISGATYRLVKDQFACSHRGVIEAKGKGDIDMYFIEHKI